ncbi:hypothetical protein [Kitasatospora sp. SUK 42]|uniref:hypothetical protein n=1 Tax=Kitasatospora sp. SUK 42 TaxID=1588882 RepID=UPI0018CBC703|nr:hypothetical protein [Kitasatospora sp. SUK 42]MBV2154358.1 hypothetical protein [Kitasatospora sp. SUK 42]
MSYPPDPNNPYDQPPAAAPGYGYPQQTPPPAAPAYGYPQAAPGYGYPQAAPGYGYPPAAPQTMPGLVTTARVLLFVVGGVQTILTIIYLIAAAVAKDATSTLKTTTEDDPFTALGDAAVGIIVVVAVLFGLFAALSITLGVKFGKGGNAVRITTIVYGSLGALVGLLLLAGAITGSTAVGLVMAVLWLAVSIIWITAMCVRDGVNWFNRPRY